MSESQFEKLLKTLETAERERDLSRHTVEVQDGIINEQREENKRLRGLLERSLTYIYTLDSSDLFRAIKKEVGDEQG